MNQKELLEIGLHEMRCIHRQASETALDVIVVFRVPGGLVYRSAFTNNKVTSVSMCFVPEPPSVLADFPEVDEYVDPFSDFLEIIRKEKKDVTPDHIADTGKKVRDDNHVGSCVDDIDATVRKSQTVEQDMIPIIFKKREPLSKLRFLAKQMSEEKISHLWAADYLKEIIEEMEAA